MPLYRCLNLANKQVQYVNAINKSQARSYIARDTIQVETATPQQVIEDTTHDINVTPVNAEGA